MVPTHVLQRVPPAVTPAFVPPLPRSRSTTGLCLDYRFANSSWLPPDAAFTFCDTVLLYRNHQLIARQDVRILTRFVRTRYRYGLAWPRCRPHVVTLITAMDSVPAGSAHVDVRLQFCNSPDTPPPPFYVYTPTPASRRWTCPADAIDLPPVTDTTADATSSRTWRATASIALPLVQPLPPAPD